MMLCPPSLLLSSPSEIITIQPLFRTLKPHFFSNRIAALFLASVVAVSSFSLMSRVISIKLVTVSVPYPCSQYFGRSMNPISALSPCFVKLHSPISFPVSSMVMMYS